LRAGDVRQAAVQDFFDERVPARHHVADDVQVRVQVHLFGPVTLDQLDALGFELGAHRRVDVGVAPGDAVAGLFGQHREAAHEGAADAEDMDVHDVPK